MCETKPVDDAAATHELRIVQYDVREYRYVWRAEVMHALDTLRGARTLNRWNERMWRRTALVSPSSPPTSTSKTPSSWLLRTSVAQARERPL